MSKELSKFLDPVAFITIIASITYIFGWSYTQAYFSRIGIQYESLNLSSSFFSCNAVWAFAVMGILIMVLDVITYKIKYFKELKNLYFSTFRDKASIILIFLLLSLIISCYLGDQCAKKVVEGEADKVFMINFSWKENPPKDMEGKELILIIHQEGKYYVVNKQKPAPKYPEVYIISDDQIKFAVIKKSHFSLGSLLKFAKNDICDFLSHTNGTNICVIRPICGIRDRNPFIPETSR